MVCYNFNESNITLHIVLCYPVTTTTKWRLFVEQIVTGYIISNQIYVCQNTQFSVYGKMLVNYLFIEFRFVETDVS